MPVSDATPIIKAADAAPVIDAAELAHRLPMVPAITSCIPAELAAIRLCDIQEAWNNGVRSIALYKALAVAICYVVMHSFEGLYAAKDWRSLRVEAHRILGWCLYLYAIACTDAFTLLDRELRLGGANPRPNPDRLSEYMAAACATLAALREALAPLVSA